MYRSELERSLSSGRITVTGEITPPAANTKEKISELVKIVKGSVTAVNITDSPMGSIRVCSLAGAIIASSEGVEPVLQVTCRDRNRIALSDEILGGYVLGIRNVLALRGDRRTVDGEIPVGGDLDTLGEIRLIAEMRRGFDAYGNCIDPLSGIYLGTIANPFIGEIDTNVSMMVKRISAGAEFIQTQAVFDTDRFFIWLKEMRNRGVTTPILPGVIPLKSYKSAIYMKENIPGIIIPDEYIERMRLAPDQKEEGLRIAGEIVNTLISHEGVNGIHLMTVRWTSAIPEIVRRCGLRIG